MGEQDRPDAVGPPPAAGAASHRDRCSATVVDTILVVAVSAVVGLLSQPLPDVARLVALVVAMMLPTFVAEGINGRSLGKAAMQLRHVRADEPLPPVTTFLPRWGLKWFVPLVVVAAGAWPLALLWWLVDYGPAFTRDRRAVHDRLAGTRVLAPPPR